ncbi:MAG: hypothetical protein KIT79_01150 [Deltaproteobacteria bacterium]|nr:hypothetical protein [Deltaproteobacteria bacterium]
MKIILEIDSLDLAQITSGLEARRDAWKRTLDYLRGIDPCDDFLIEECKDASEAEAIYKDYDRILSDLYHQETSYRQQTGRVIGQLLSSFMAEHR